MLKFKYIILILGFSLFLHCTLFPQEFIQAGSEKKQSQHSGRFDTDRLFYGCGLGLQFGTNTLIELSPLIGYRFTERFGTGVGLSYYYMARNVYPVFSTNIYGAKLISYYNFAERFFFYGEYEALSLESKYFNPGIYPDTKRFFIGSLLVGPGLRYKIGDRSSINLLILWNLNDNIYSPYSNPVIRMSFEI